MQADEPQRKPFFLERVVEFFVLYIFGLQYMIRVSDPLREFWNGLGTIICHPMVLTWAMWFCIIAYVFGK